MELLIGSHDPEGRMTSQIQLLKPVLGLFDSTIAAVTPGSVADTRTRLTELGVDVLEGSTLLHETKLVMMRRSRSTVFCTELDKLLHMQQFFPDELEALSRFKPNGFVLLGRTQKAFDTYPASWRVNEGLANAEAAKVIGIPEIDVAVGDFIADRAVVELLQDRPILRGCECCVGMPADVTLSGHAFSYVSLDCLEWEDPDRYPNEIRSQGRENWERNLYDSPKEWVRRRSEREDYSTAILRLRDQLHMRERLGLPISPITSFKINPQV